jgi:hypothetical protein
LEIKLQELGVKIPEDKLIEYNILSVDGMAAAVHSDDPNWIRAPAGVSAADAAILASPRAFGTIFEGKLFWNICCCCGWLLFICLCVSFVGPPYKVDKYEDFDDAFRAYLVERRVVKTVCSSKRAGLNTTPCGVHGVNRKFFFDPECDQFRLILKQCPCGAYMYPCDATPYVTRSQARRIFERAIWATRTTQLNTFIEKISNLFVGQQTYSQLKQKDE